MEDKTIGKMGSVPVKRLLLQLGLPFIVSMMLQALYNIVDSAFISNMKAGGEQALNALTLAFPLQMLMVAFSIGTGVGVNVCLARSLGQQNGEKAARVGGNAVFLGIVITAVFMLFGLVGVEPYVASQTQNPEIRAMAVSYLRICTLVSVGIVFFGIFEKLLQATGLSLYSTAAQITGAVVNIVLDPIMIYGLLGCPEMGVAGAAWATVIGQVCSFLLALLFHLKKNRAVGRGLRYLRPSGALIREIYAVGLPAIIAQALMSVMTYAVNLILGSVHEALVTAYGLYYKIQQFILFAAFGLRDAISPVVSFANGMGSRERVTEGVRWGLIYTVGIMLIGTLLLEALAGPLCAAFGLSGQTETLCRGAIRVISLSFVFAGINVPLQAIFQALGRGADSLLVSVCRQLLFILPSAWLLSRLVQPDLSNAWVVWLSFIFTELATAAVAALRMRRVWKRDVLTLRG